MSKTKDPHRLPKRPMIEKAVQELMDCNDITAIQVRTRAAHILWKDCKPFDENLIVATLVFDYMFEKDVLENFNPKVADYARDMKWFQQRPMGLIMAAPAPLKAFYLAINIAATEMVADEFIEDLEIDPHADPDDLMDMQEMLRSLYNYIGELPYPKLMKHFDDLNDEIDYLCFGDDDDDDEFTPGIKDIKITKPLGDIKIWIKKNARKPK